MTSAPALRSDVVLMPVTKGSNTIYYLKDAQAGSLYEFSAQEHALLVMLDGQTGLDDLVTRFERQQGVALALDELQAFISNLHEWGLLVEPPSKAAATKEPGATQVPVPSEVDEEGLDKDSGLPAPERSGHDERRGRPASYRRMFESDAFYARLARSLTPLYKLAYVLPVVLVVALITVMYNSHYIANDFTRLWKPVTFIQHLLVVLLTVNFWSKFMTGVVCRGMGGEVPGFGYAFRGMVPRFEVELQGVGKLTRRQRMWITATPLLVKLLLFSVGVLLWSMTRASGSSLALFGYDMAGIALVSFLLTANPFGKSDGYDLLSSYLGMPRLRRRAFGMLFSNFLPTEKRQALERALQGIDARPFRIYAIISLLYSAVLLGTVLYFVALWLERSFSGFGVVVFLAIVAALAYQMRGPIGRLRTPRTEGEAIAADEPLKERILRWARSHRKLSGGLVLFAIISILPYPYEPGGEFQLRPAHFLGVHAETEGIVEEIYFKGGEWVAATSLIARLASYEQEKSVAVSRAQVAAQESMLNRLLATPRPEEVALRKAQVEKARAEADFKKNEFKREEKLYQKQIISEQEYMTAKSDMDQAVNRHLEEQAKLTLTLAGPHPDEIAAARAELERLRHTLRYHEEQLKRTRMVMPIDGHLATTHLRDLVGAYVKEGTLITDVSDDRTLLAEIELPESDIEGVRVDAKAKVKVWAYPDELVSGKVTQIDPVADKKRYGKVVKVTIEVPNVEFRLKSGMTGYGKVSAGTVPVITAFTRWLVRFFALEMWSWLP